MVSRTPSRDSRAWLLLQLAHALRRRGRCGDALEALELAVRVSRSAGPELAAYACAVAVHLAAGDRDTAAKVAGSGRLLASEAGLLRALGEAYVALFHDTGEAALLDEAFTCFEQASLAAAAASHRGEHLADA